MLESRIPSRSTQSPLSDDPIFRKSCVSCYVTKVSLKSWKILALWAENDFNLESRRGGHEVSLLHSQQLLLTVVVHPVGDKVAGILLHTVATAAGQPLKAQELTTNQK